MARVTQAVGGRAGVGTQPVISLEGWQEAQCFRYSFHWEIHRLFESVCGAPGAVEISNLQAKASAGAEGGTEYQGSERFMRIGGQNVRGLGGAGE